MRGSLAILMMVALGPAALQGEVVTLSVDKSEAALISGFREKWNTPQPAQLVFDAVHRSLLVRFPGAAERVAAQVAKGYRVQKLELLLPFKDTEFAPPYKVRWSFGGTEHYKKVKPQWHAVAWALRRPWEADDELGPTFNAYINGAGYWARYGAQDTAHDRFPRRFGPTEVSYKQTLARMDVTAALTDAAFGNGLAERLRRLEDCGFLLRKWEVYDFRFRKNGDGAYEWQVATGGHGIKVGPPKLVVTFATREKGETVRTLGPAADIKAMAAELKRNATGGKATAVMPTPQELKTILERYSLKRPSWMPQWQWKRVQQLDALGGGYRIPASAEGYAKWIDNMLTDPPRYWNGWDVPDRLLTWYLYRDALPAPVVEHYCNNYWTAWLMPDRPTSELEHPQAIELWHKGKNRYYEQTGDWRGNASFYRDGYCYAMSTMNFNHTAAMGALLGGNIIGSEYAMEDGRHGLEHWPLRTWCWYDGSTQESIDHYYFALTLSAQKMFADFGPTHLDRMMGRSILAKSVEELTSAYHPGLRHFISSSQRTAFQYVLVTQDGLQHIVHTLSHSGALHDLDSKQIPGGMEAIGHDTPPGRIAQQTATGPWAPEWIANMVDEKPLPYEMTNTFKMWGGHAANPLWRRTYLGKHYGLASTDLHWGVVQVLGQWRRDEGQVSALQDLGTMTVRYGINTTPLVNHISGWMESQGNVAVMQHRNKMIVVTSPYEMSGREGVKSLQTTIGLFNYQPEPTWEIYVDARRVMGLPLKAASDQRITIKDGVSYLGIVPLPATDLGRKDEIVLAEGVEQLSYPNQIKIKPALVVNSYNLQREEPLGKAADWGPIDRAYGGFVVELGDETEYGEFAAFQRHIQSAKLDARWEPQKSTLHVRYESGGDTMELGCRTDYKQGRPSPECFTYRRVNGQWPYLPKGIERDTTLTQQGTTGRLEKNGAVLRCEPGRMAYLQTEPVTGTYAGFNPLPDPTMWSLYLPGGVRVETDGRVSMLRVIVRPRQNKVRVDYAIKADQTMPDMATALLVFGLEKPPTAERNGKQCSDELRPVKVRGRTAYLVPLFEGTADEALKGVLERYERSQRAFSVLEK